MLPNLPPTRATCRTTRFSFRVTFCDVFWAHLRKTEALQLVAAAWNRHVARAGGKTSNTTHQLLTQETLHRSLRSRRTQGVLFGSGATARSERRKREGLLEEARPGWKIPRHLNWTHLHSFRRFDATIIPRVLLWRNSSSPSYTPTPLP